MMVIIGVTTYALLIAGFGWALVDLLIRILKQPRRPFILLRMTSYPFVPDDETLQAMCEKQEHGGKLQPSPVPVRSNYR